MQVVAPAPNQFYDEAPKEHGTPLSAGEKTAVAGGTAMKLFGPSR